MIIQNLLVSVAQFCEQGRLRIAIGIDVDRIDRDAGFLDVVACPDAGIGAVVHAPVDDLTGLAPAVLCIQAVRHQDDDFVVDVIWILGRSGERAAADQRLPGPHQPDWLIGVAVGLQVVDQVVHPVPVVAQALHLRRTTAVLLGRPQRRVDRCRRPGDLAIVVVELRAAGAAAIGDAAVPGLMRAAAGAVPVAVIFPQRALVADAAASA